MKRIFLFIFLLCNILVQSQTVQTTFGGYATVQSVSGTGPTFTLNLSNFQGNFRFEPDGQYLGVDVQVGDVIWLNCARYVINTINSSTATSINVVVQVPAADWAIGVSTPLTGQRLAVLRETDGLPSLPQTGDGNSGAISGVSTDLYNCIMNHYMTKLLNSSNSVNEIAYTSGNVPPSNSVATSLGYKLAKSNMGDGDLYEWNGSAWILNQRTGGSSTVETVRDSAILRSYTGAADVLILRETSRQGVFVKNNSTTETVDQYMVFTDANSNKWVRQWDYTTVQAGWFGAVPGDGINDDYGIQQAVNYAISKNYGIVKLSNGEYRINKGILLAKPNSTEYTFFTLTLEGASEDAYVTNQGTTFNVLNPNTFAIAIQYGRNVTVKGITFSGQKTTYPSPKQTVEWVDSDWNQGATIRDNVQSPHAAIVIDPFNTTVTSGNRYPSWTGNYTNTGNSGTSMCNLEGLQITNFIVGVGHNLSTSNQNGDNVILSRSRMANVKTAWATGQTQSRGNSIRDCYFVGAIQTIADAYNYGQQNGTLPKMFNLNIAGGTKLIFWASNQFEGVHLSSVYAESLYAIGISAGHGNSFTGCTFKFLQYSDEQLYAPPFHYRVANDGTVSFTGCSFIYFANGTKKYSLKMDGRNISYDNCFFEVGSIIGSDIFTESLDIRRSKNFADSYALDANGDYFNNKNTISLSTEQTQIFTNTKFNTQESTGQGKRIYNYSNQETTQSNSIIGLDYGLFYIGAPTITVDATNKTAKFVTPANSNRIKVGDFVWPETYTTEANSVFYQLTSTSIKTPLGWVSSISGDTINLSGIPYGLTTGTKSIYLAFNKHHQGRVVGTLNGTTSVTNVSGMSSAYKVGDRIYGNGIDVGTYVVSSTTTTITLSRAATTSGISILSASPYKIEDYPKSVPIFTNTVWDKGDILYNSRTSSSYDTVQNWICIRGGLVGSTQEPLFVATKSGRSINANDLSFQSASTGQVLKFDGTGWKPGTDLSGGGGASIDSVVVTNNTNGISVKVNTTSSTFKEIPLNSLAQSSATTNQIPQWNGTDWVAVNLPSVVDNSITNEGSLTVNAGTSTTSVISSNTSTSTDVTLSAGTGMGLSETGNTITIANTLPDVTVSLTNGGGVGITGSYPNFTLTATDQSVTNEILTITDGTNTEALGGQTLTLNGAGITTVTYNPATNTATFTSNEVDASLNNEGVIGVGAGGANSSTIISNTTGASGATISGGTGITITETTATNGGSVTIANSLPDVTVSLTGAGATAITGTYPNFTVTTTEVDGTIGNEITNSTDGTLVRSGAGTSGSPYTLDIATGGITNTDIADATIGFSKFAQNSATTGQVISWNGTAWNATTLAAATNFWSRSGTTLSTATAGDKVVIGNTTSTAERLHVEGTTADATINTIFKGTGATPAVQITNNNRLSVNTALSTYTLNVMGPVAFGNGSNFGNETTFFNGPTIEQYSSSAPQHRWFNGTIGYRQVLQSDHFAVEPDPTTSGNGVPIRYKNKAGSTIFQVSPVNSNFISWGSPVFQGPRIDFNLCPRAMWIPRIPVDSFNVGGGYGGVFAYNTTSDLFQGVVSNLRHTFVTNVSSDTHTTGDVLTWNGSGWLSQGISTTLDQAYNNFGATASKITVDAAESQTGGLEFETSGSNNFIVDMQGTGDVLVQDAGSTVFQVLDNGYSSFGPVAATTNQRVLVTETNASISTPLRVSNNATRADGGGVLLPLNYDGSDQAALQSFDPIGSYVNQTNFNVKTVSGLEPFIEVNADIKEMRFNNAVAYEIFNATSATEDLSGRESYVDVGPASSTTTINLPEITTGFASTRQVRTGYTLIFTIVNSSSILINTTGSDVIYSTGTSAGSSATSITTTSNIVTSFKLVAVASDRWVMLNF